LVVHIVLTTVLIYFLMLNFLLAIVVESYMAVRSDLEANEVSSDFVTDVVTTFHHTAIAFAIGWPSLREVANMLRFKIIKKSISARILRIASGYPSSVVNSIFDTYFCIECLQAKVNHKLTLHKLVKSIRKKSIPMLDESGLQHSAKEGVPIEVPVEMPVTVCEIDPKPGPPCSGISQTLGTRVHPFLNEIPP
jgi:hypothetical protein